MKEFLGEDLRTRLPLPRDGCFLPPLPQSSQPRWRLCQTYGHSWELLTDRAAIKQCQVCGITGYCPGCTPVAPTREAQPFFCTRHTLSGSNPPAESEVTR